MSDRLVILLEKLTDNMELDLGGLRDQLRAELAALKAGQGEAVAWMTGPVVWGSEAHAINHARAHRMHVAPLYASPPASAAARLVPVELLELCFEGFDDHWITLPEGMECTQQLRALLARSAASAAARLVPLELLERIDGALTRHMDGHAPMRVPVDMTDSDIVQAELRALVARQEVKS